MKRILFVCTGNTCRSPMAEAMLRRLAQESGIDLEVRSAGVAAVDHLPVSVHALTILREKGMEEDLRSTSFSANWAEWAEIILTMTVHHKQEVIQRFPQTADKTFTLKEYAEDDPETLAKVKNWEQMYANFQIKQALSQPITKEEEDAFFQLEQNMPDYNIADPFGGSLDAYRDCAAEIEAALHKLVAKIKKMEEKP